MSPVGRLSFSVRAMSSAVVRVGVVVLTLIEFGVTGFYAPAHRLLHHTLRPVAASKSAAPATGCHSRCCHHHAAMPDSTVGDANGGQRPPSHSTDAPCPDDESHCAWCAIALQPADATSPAAVVAAPEPVEFVATFARAPVTARTITPFDVRGPPVL